MKAYVLAAGYGTRLHPITRDRAKPLLQVGGAPILSHIVDRLRQLPGLSEIVVVANHRFHEQFVDWAASYPCPVPVRILDDGSTDDENRLGAIADLALAVDRFPPRSEDWLVVAGDNLLDFDLRPLLQRFQEGGRSMLVVREVNHGVGPTRYNEVTLGQAGQVEAFREKPPDPATGISAIALYFFTPAVVSLLERYLSEGGTRDAPGHFIAWLAPRTPLGSAFFDGEWFDIGSHETLEEARERFRPASRPHAGG